MSRVPVSVKFEGLLRVVIVTDVEMKAEAMSLVINAQASLHFRQVLMQASQPANHVRSDWGDLRAGKR